MEHYEDGTLSRGEWKLENGTLSYCADSFEQAQQLKRELSSLGGSKVECEGAFLYCAIGEEWGAAVRELREAGFAVSGDYEGAPFLFHVETQGAKTTDQGTLRLRFASAIEDEARERYNALRESDTLAELRLSRFDPEDGSREFLEGCETHGEGDSLAMLALSGKIRGEVYEVLTDELEGYSALGYGDLDRHGRSMESLLEIIREGRARFVFVSDRATGSDYGGDGSVGKSNLRELLALAAESSLVSGSDYWELDGAHGSYGIAFRAGLRCAALSEVFLALEDYPLISDDSHSEIESEEESEAMESYVLSDFKRALASREALDLDGCEDEALSELFETARERSNTYFAHSSEGASIDVDRIVKSVKRSEVVALPGAVREDEAEQAQALALLSAARPCFDKLEDEAEAEPSEREAYSLPEAVEALRASLGAPAETTIRDCAYFLSQVSRWPIGETPSADPAAELATLRRHVGAVVQSARMRLAELDPERAKCDEASQGAYAALPRETPPLS
jgi:hypothetical protein